MLSESDVAAEAAAAAELARIAAAREDAQGGSRAAKTQAECRMYRATHHNRGCICAARWDGCSFGGHDLAARDAGLLDYAAVLL